MIKALIFDLDGVITNTSDLHYSAFYDAVYHVFDIKISRALYDRWGTLPSVRRLDKLVANEYLPNNFDKIAAALNYKQTITHDLIKTVPQNQQMNRLLFAASNFYQLAVASNATHTFVCNILKHLNYYCYFTIIVGNTDVVESKPNPEMFDKCIAKLEVKPKETIIIEDSPTGLVAAYKSGAHVFRVASPGDLIASDLLKIARNL